MTHALYLHIVQSVQLQMPIKMKQLPATPHLIPKPSHLEIKMLQLKWCTLGILNFVMFPERMWKY